MNTGDRKFLTDEIKAGKLLHSKGHLNDVSDSNVSKLAAIYINARKKTDLPMSYAIARAINEGFLDPTSYKTFKEVKK
jgi:hypothetical protein